METLITPLEALRSARIEARRAEVNASRVDFFTPFAEITYDLTTRFYRLCRMPNTVFVAC